MNTLSKNTQVVKETIFSEKIPVPTVENTLHPADTSSRIQTMVNPAVFRANVYNPPLFEREGCRLYMNENLMGPSPECLKVLQQLTAEQMFLYPYGGNHLIVNTIAERLGVSPEEVVVNAGAASVLQQIFQTFIEKGDVICLSKPGWDYYRGVAETLGAEISYYSIKEADMIFHFDVDEMIQQFKKVNPKIIMITSPNMPTGNVIAVSDLERIADTFQNSLILLDEVYYGFGRAQVINEPEMLAKHPNLLIIRTFSKYYALASLRVGYVLADRQLAQYINKMTPLFGIPAFAQLVVKAALDDQSYYEMITDRTILIRDQFRQKVNQLEGMWVYPSESNFILINTTIWSPDEIVKYCREAGFLIRDCKGYGLKSHIRVSIGKEEHMIQIAELLQAFVNSQN